MAKDSSASTRQQTPHLNQTTTNQTGTTATAIESLKYRAHTVINDKSIDAESRAIIRYGLETNDPWLAELVTRVEAGENIADSCDFSQTTRTETELYSRSS